MLGDEILRKVLAMARIYTGTGDQGQTSLGDGTRTEKFSARIDLYGDIDELNSVLGCCLTALPSGDAGSLQTLRVALADIQSQLFELGSVIADPGRCQAFAEDSEHPFPVRSLEILIDSLTLELSPLKSFVLPGGTAGSGFLHLGRTVCRRAERKAVALAQDEPLPAAALVYLNRLSDFLFTAARSVNAASGIEDVLWLPSGQEK